jgi:hypothetical protein
MHVCVISTCVKSPAGAPVDFRISQAASEAPAVKAGKSERKELTTQAQRSQR